MGDEVSQRERSGAGSSNDLRCSDGRRWYEIAESNPHTLRVEAQGSGGTCAILVDETLARRCTPTTPKYHPSYHHSQLP